MSNFSTLLRISRVVSRESLTAITSFSNLSEALHFFYQQNTDQQPLGLITNDNVWYWIVPTKVAEQLTWVGFHQLVTLTSS